MKALVVGYGSIGRRHARLLAAQGHDVSLVTSQQTEEFPVLPALAEGLRVNPDYVIIANDTARHYSALEVLARSGYAGTVLVEKPLFEKMHNLPANRFTAAAVAYNLRFHPVIQYLRERLGREKIISAHVYVGQYLPEWRPGTDYANSYSAGKAGGGVLLDLSHELDYACWLFGGWERVAATGGHFSELNIASDDVYALLLKTPACPVVSVTMNYLDRRGRREIIVNTAEHTYKADLVSSNITVDKDGGELVALPDRDSTYIAQHTAMLNKDFRYLCSLDQGLEVMRLIGAVWQAVREGRWIDNA